MLIETPLKIDDVVSIKLANGDEIIAKLTGITDTTFTVSKPLLMVLSQDPRTGQPGVQMAPFWIMGADLNTKFPINRSQVTCAVKTNSEAVKSYLQQTTGLAIPGAGASGLIT
jgi:hypothetical protein